MLFSWTLMSFMLSALCLLLPIAAAEDIIKLVFPPGKGNGKTELSFPAGKDVPLQWTCTFPMFTMQIWQGPDVHGTRAFTNLLTNVTDTSVRRLSWPAARLAGFTSDIPMHIRVFNSADKDCDSCNVISEDFSVTGGTKTNSTGGTGAAAPVATATVTSSGSNLGVALGVGLGLGIPLAAVITSIVTFCCLRKRWREPEIRTADPYEAPLTAWKQPPPSSHSNEPPSAGFYGSDVQKPFERPQYVPGPVELQPELMRVEAPRDNERIELDANMSRSNLSRKFSWQQR